ncbi:acetyl-CoA C-acetyltransferase [Paraburkholderia pallida]|uniref:Acetyl-CoA C-acetyltransferase n=1 Tax=Paraburkholderia pallida TaxID=2547399 RepID=A0A4P7CTM4_9BURK|nr:acetyl-CoA C-acetyltransferase [Paraburkholderia pallida]QBQ99350.1 acetyl-CoA C-acetyltransferase [Paraburkholderia pallida]
MSEALIFDALRTPRGKGRADGALYEVKPISLLSGVLRELQQRHDLDTGEVDDVVMGIVAPVGEQGGNLAKIAALNAGWDWNASGVQLNRYCASGLEAVNLAAQKVRSGWEDLVVAGGVESMSRIPMGSDGGAWAQDPQTAMDLGFVPQGIGADLQAMLDGYTREDLDAYALASQQRAAAAREGGRFARSLVPVRDASGMVILEHDELIRPNSTMEGLAALKPAFDTPGKMGFDARAIRYYPQVQRIEHVHTSGNSSGIVDGAAALLIGSEKKGRDLGLTPRARVVATAVTGSEPVIMLTGPAPAAHKALAKAGMTVEQIDLFEVNEAFASVPLRFMRLMDVPHEKVNVNGGAIALGHPLGATGAMLLGTLLDELEARNLRYGLVTLCAAAGIGIATIIERL